MIQLPAFGWTFNQPCDGTPGSNVPGLFSLSVYDDAVLAQSGPTSCRLGIRGGTNGWNDWGGTMEFPQPLVRGDEIWLRLYIYVPSSFDYGSNTGLKFMRVHTDNADGSNAGYFDIIHMPDGYSHWDDYSNTQTNLPYFFNYEGSGVPKHFFGDYSDRWGANRDGWISYELYAKLDNVPVTEGGMAEARIWIDNELALHTTNLPTINAPDTISDFFFLFTYWNGNAPKDQHLWVDNIIITSDEPLNRDADNFPFIGGEVVPRPSPPPNVR